MIGKLSEIAASLVRDNRKEAIRIETALEAVSE
jgi:hypothetical protein